ncbi:unnamed protein product [Clavelina lepadiformis]|uniref:Uncharacterized protein n=1 Tax=Clavelina lepadiformis TaxID=159417 RepID=A0ABP0EZQ7_CLALP
MGATNVVYDETSERVEEYFMTEVRGKSASSEHLGRSRQRSWHDMNRYYVTGRNYAGTHDKEELDYCDVIDTKTKKVFPSTSACDDDLKRFYIWGILPTTCTDSVKIYPALMMETDQHQMTISLVCVELKVSLHQDGAASWCRRRRIVKFYNMRIIQLGTCGLWCGSYSRFLCKADCWPDTDPCTKYWIVIWNGTTSS